jgi:hypothetical protein
VDGLRVSVRGISGFFHWVSQLMGPRGALTDMQLLLVLGGGHWGDFRGQLAGTLSGRHLIQR